MKNNLFIKKIILLIAILFSSERIVAGKNFIFDFGGVLLLPNKMASLKHLGIANIASCSIRLGINPFHLSKHIKSKLFAVLNTIGEIHGICAQYPYHCAYDEIGNPLPPLMCAWLQGLMTNQQIKTMINKEIIEHPEWFGCNAEQRIISNLTNFIFTPELLVETFTVSQAGMAFVKKCKREGHSIYGLSNWDAESFELLRIKHAELFDLFDGIILSGQVKANKPHATIYHILLNQYQLQAKDCWFIDDQQENIDAAQKIGINAIRHTSTFTRIIKMIQEVSIRQKCSLRNDFINNGTIESSASSANIMIIDGENISFIDSSDDNCLPANE